MSSKLINCKACGSEVSGNAKICPHCGEKLKMGMFQKLWIVGVSILILSSVLAPTEEEFSKTLDEIASAQPSNLSANGELATIYRFGGDTTTIQRDEKEKQIKGMIVDWELPVYNVRVGNEEKKSYRVQTNGSDETVGTFITVYARSPAEESFLKSLKTGDYIHIKGKVNGVSMRNIDVDPAVLVGVS